MKKLVIAALVVAAGYFAYTKIDMPKPHPTMGNYHPETAATNPIPKDIVIDGAKPYAISGCDIGEQTAKDSKQECLDNIEKWHDDCKQRIMADMPDKVDSTDMYRQYVRRYFKCVNPKLQT